MSTTLRLSDKKISPIWTILAFHCMILLYGACNENKRPDTIPTNFGEEPYLLVLGIAQDAGYPQAGCLNECCRDAWIQPELRKSVASLAIMDPVSNQGWIIDATPDFKMQLQRMESHNSKAQTQLAGILLTHAHIGHYTGLMHLGREVMGAKSVPVFAMPRMSAYLKNNGPWSQLVELRNIELIPMNADSAFHLSSNIVITPLLVPHRDEFSETVAFIIEGPSKKLLYIPDIDKWHLWERDILALITGVDFALLDATFFQNGEIPNRDMSEIPHPFVEESMNLFKDLPVEEKKKVHFIHFNHTNPLLLKNSEAGKTVMEAGFHISKEGMIFPL